MMKIENHGRSDGISDQNISEINQCINIIVYFIYRHRICTAWRIADLYNANKQ